MPVEQSTTYRNMLPRNLMNLFAFRESVGQKSLKGNTIRVSDKIFFHWAVLARRLRPLHAGSHREWLAPALQPCPRITRVRAHTSHNRCCGALQPCALIKGCIFLQLLLMYVVASVAHNFEGECAGVTSMAWVLRHSYTSFVETNNNGKLRF